MKLDDSKNVFCFIARISTLIGGFFYCLCFVMHICVCGHMKHPPYTVLDAGIDFMWWGFWGIAIVASFLCRKKRAFFAAVLLVILIIIRTFFDSFGGGGIFLEIPSLSLALALLMPIEFFTGFFRRHFFIPLVFLFLFLLANSLDGLRLLLYESESRWLCFHPKMLISPMTLIGIVLAIISNEIMLWGLFSKQEE